MTLVVRIIIGITLILAGGFYYLIDWMVSDIRPRYLEATEEPLVDIANILAATVETDMLQTDMLHSYLLADAMQAARRRRFEATIYRLVKQQVNMRLYITDARGMVVYDSDEGRDEGRDYSRWNDVHLSLLGKYGVRSTRSDPNNPATSTLYVSAPIYRKEQLVGVLSVGKPTTSVARFVEAAKSQITIVSLFTAATMLALGMIFSIWVTRPIARLTDYARAVRDGQRAGLPGLGRSEIATLGKAFEEMKDALEGRKYVENYVQTLTHELKSPLSSLRGAAELLREDMPPEQRQKFLANIDSESARIQAIVEKMLQLAALESRKGLEQIDTIDLSGVIQEAIASVMPLSERKNLSIEFTLPKEDALVPGERFLIIRAVLNLLQNAIEFTPPGSSIHITLHRKPGAWTISIRDEGEGIPDFALDKVFDRFYSLPRPDTGKKSTGLGLSFVREVALLHGGAIHLENRTDAPGAVATFSLAS